MQYKYYGTSKVYQNNFYLQSNMEQTMKKIIDSVKSFFKILFESLIEARARQAQINIQNRNYH